MDRTRLAEILSKLKDVSIAVVGDYFLDEYLHVDPKKNEPSLETGLTAYQVVRRVISPGAAGTVAKNLAVLGVGAVYAVGYIGDDGRGVELSQALRDNNVNCDNLITSSDRATPTYTKPMLIEEGAGSEMSRYDIKNWTPTPGTLEDEIIQRVIKLEKKLDAIIVLDQLTEKNYGVVTEQVRKAISLIAGDNRELIVFADSRNDSTEFENMIIKGNQYEMARSVFVESHDENDMEIVKRRCEELARMRNRPVVVTMGENGALIATGERLYEISPVKVDGPLDICGAGDAFSAGLVSALSCGASLPEAGYVGNLVAAVCVTQLGTTGIATAEMVLEKSRF